MVRGPILHRFRHYPAGTGKHKYFPEPYRICIAYTDVTLILCPEWADHVNPRMKAVIMQVLNR